MVLLSHCTVTCAISAAVPTSILTGVAAEQGVSDQRLEALLQRVYVESGFTDPEVAQVALRASAVRARGELIAVCDSDSGVVCGIVMVVGGEAPGRRLATEGEVEMHLLAVDPEHRGRGYGQILVEAALTRARALGASRMILWTQTSMQAAQRLYLRAGFLRQPARDFHAVGRAFLVMERALS
jgi:ribosomal protein S18 acetylase RimI-like enzyme